MEQLIANGCPLPDAARIAEQVMDRFERDYRPMVIAEHAIDMMLWASRRVMMMHRWMIFTCGVLTLANGFSIWWFVWRLRHL